MTNSQNSPQRKKTISGRFWFGSAIVLIAAAALGSRVYFQQQATELRDDSQSTAWDSSWPELPESVSPTHPIEFIRAAYAFAARRPDVVRYLPCYCGCEKQGHQSLQFCFVKKRTASGIAEWDHMGFT